MARRCSRKPRKISSKSSRVSPHTVRLIAGGCVLLLAVAAVAELLSPNEDSSPLHPVSFDVDGYRQGGSRFATPGNTYVLKARVESIDSRGNDRVLAVSLPAQQEEKTNRLPLVLKDGSSGGVNVTRGDTFLFEVTCRNGRDETGRPVKGIFIVNRVQPSK